MNISTRPVTNACLNAKLWAMTPMQCRVARAYLDWSQPQLATAAGVSVSTVVDFERQRRAVARGSVRAIRLALENAGIIFETNGTVRQERPRKK